jgi:hypothetical protein
MIGITNISGPQFKVVELSQKCHNPETLKTNNTIVDRLIWNGSKVSVSN